MTGAVLLFDDFETLDAMGPAEVLGHKLAGYRLEFWSWAGGPVSSSQGVQVMTAKAPDNIGDAVGGARPAATTEIPEFLLIPGGQGTRSLATSPEFLSLVRRLSEAVPWTLTVCTGSGLLAATGLLDGRRATSNKRAFDWPRSVRPQVDWIPQARWIVDGSFYTSSGVTAGIDMSLSFVADRHGRDRAQEIAAAIEHVWIEESTNDPFAIP